MRILIASHNKDKIREIIEIIDDNSIEIVSPEQIAIPDVIEDEETLLGNALKKARSIAEVVNIPTIADDTGLFVDALDGAPGVYSARYAGEECSYQDNRRKLLKELKMIENTELRTARFKTVVVLYFPTGEQVTAEGVVEGYITTQERGDKGFGYDAVFQVKESGKTFAEMDEDEKNKISHRGLALNNLVAEMERLSLIKKE
ncbi:MAG: RdgB/HAM1 family non-canonical purine NTP pyrophosphatase [Candidatus Cloacimonas sp.]|nr:RdgB/HAM1 family non-canonical purine NTP pyrophosphatase [Candidatus Cloacimonadota bacterium]